MKTRISLALGLLGTVIGGIVIYRNRQKWNREMLYRLARLEADLLEALRESPERRKQIPENSLVVAIPDFDEELADQNRKLAKKEGKNYASVTYCYVMKKAKGVKIYRIEVVDTVRKV